MTRGHLRHSAGPHGCPPILLVTPESRPFLQKIGPRVTPNLLLLTPPFACPRRCSPQPKVTPKPCLAAPPQQPGLSKAIVPLGLNPSLVWKLQNGPHSRFPPQKQSHPMPGGCGQGRDREARCPGAQPLPFPRRRASPEGIRDTSRRPRAARGARALAVPSPRKVLEASWLGMRNARASALWEVSCSDPLSDPLRSQAALRRRSAMPG